MFLDRTFNTQKLNYSIFCGRRFSKSTSLYVKAEGKEARTSIDLLVFVLCLLLLLDKITGVVQLLFSLFYYKQHFLLDFKILTIYHQTISQSHNVQSVILRHSQNYLYSRPQTLPSAVLYRSMQQKLLCSTQTVLALPTLH